MTSEAEEWLQAQLGAWLFVGSGNGPWWAASKKTPGLKLGPFDNIGDALAAALEHGKPRKDEEL